MRRGLAYRWAFEKFVDDPDNPIVDVRVRGVFDTRMSYSVQNYTEHLIPGTSYDVWGSWALRINAMEHCWQPGPDYITAFTRHYGGIEANLHPPGNPQNNPTSSSRDYGPFDPFLDLQVHDYCTLVSNQPGEMVVLQMRGYARWGFAYDDFYGHGLQRYFGGEYGDLDFEIVAIHEDGTEQ